jgi:glyoxylase-like metal-dependent hydrolase (beta-lactamase superfamily II)
MRAVSLHPDVLMVTSALLQVKCVVVRGGVAMEEEGNDETPVKVLEVSGGGRASNSEPTAETFVIDSPVLPEELEALPALIGQAGFPAPSGLLATHGDWDHLLGRLAFPAAALGVAESTAERLAAAPGEVQRDLRRFDEELMIERPRPLALGEVQSLPVPGRCELGDRELELHPTSGHTGDGMAVVAPWAGVLVVGDYLSSVEPPSLGEGADLDGYLATLQRLVPLVTGVGLVVPGHGPVLDSARALAILEEDVAYLQALAVKGAEAELPPGRRGRMQRALHAENARRSLTARHPRQ